LPTNRLGVYSGTYLHFGISDYGEIMPFQFPIGNEHLEQGSFISGYNIAYFDGVFDNVTFAAFENQLGINAVSYTEIKNTSEEVIVEVVTRTADSRIEITRLFTFDRDDKYIRIETTLKNISGAALTNVAMKSFADWDIDNSFDFDNWDYDLTRNMVYAWESNYAAIASEQVPDFMDINGWDDYTVRPTFVDFPIGPVFNFDGLEILHFELGSLSPGQTAQVNTAYGAGASLAELQEVIDRGLTGVGWLSADPNSGTIPAGMMANVTITFDATGLFGGEYNANIIVSSNDPDEPEVTVPTFLHVTGAPDIAVSDDSLDFGNAFVGFPDSLTLVVSNVGTDLLTVSDISANNPEFTVGISAFSLNPGEDQAVPVIFTPSAVGASSASLTITSDDPNEPIYPVFLQGEGLIPPQIAVTPDSLSDSLFTGETSTHTLTIDNSGGGSDLVFEISVQNLDLDAANVSVSSKPSQVLPNRKVSPLSKETGALFRGNSKEPHPGEPVLPFNAIESVGDSSILIIQNFFPWGLDMFSFIVNNFGITPTVINSSQISATDFSQFDIVITVGDQGFDYYSAISSNVSKFEDFVANGGVVQYQLATQGDNVSIVNGVNVVFGNGENFNQVLLPNHPIVEGLPTILEGNAANHCYLANLPPDAAIITETVNSLVPTTVEYSFGNGTVIATGMTWEFLYINGYNSGPMLYNATAYSLSLSGVKWLSVEPGSGVIPAGSSLDVTVTFDTEGLLGGDYNANIIVSSNDPATPEVTVPAHLHVAGAPNITVMPDSMAFDTVFVGFSASDTLKIMNSGTDMLVISNITSSDTAFSVDKTSLNIPPEAEDFVLVTFAPVTAGLATADLTITSNDPNQGLLNLPLRGTGAFPPSVYVNPDSISAEVLEGDSTTRPLVIGNNGAGDLHWSIQVTKRNTLTLNSALIQRLTQRFLALGATGIQWNGPEVSYRLQGEITIDGNTEFYEYSNTITVSNQLEDVHVLFTGTDWSILQVELEARGAQTTIHTGLITPAVLSAADVLVINDDTNPATSEITFIRNWIDNGGGLIIDADNDITEYNTIINGSGIAYLPTGATTGVTTNITPHPVTQNITVYLIAFGGDATASLNVSGSALDVIRQMNAVPHAAVGGLGRGLVVAVADESISNAGITRVGHLALALNSVAWLAIPNWITASPTAGTVLPGDSVEVTVELNAADLAAGLYEAFLRIVSDDPYNPAMNVPVRLEVGPVGIDDPYADNIPVKYELMQNYPNPFNPETRIRFGLPKVSKVKLELFNILGQRVLKLIDEQMPAGYHVITLDGRELASGMYFYRIQAEEFTDQRKMILIK